MQRTVFLCFAVGMVGCGGPGAGAGDDKDQADKIKAARRTIQSLQTACGTFELNNDRKPNTLKELTTTQPNGDRPLVPPEALKDPWGNPYQYDQSGPKHNGAEVDIWTKTPDGKTIGNWEAKSD
jgi:hypothetical protein